MNVVPTGRLGPGKLLPAAVVALTLLVFGLAIYLVTQQLRQKIRDQIASRDGEILQEIVRLEQTSATDEAELTGALEDPANQVALLLQTSKLRRLKEVMAIRLFEPGGNFVEAFPAHVEPADLSEADAAEVNQFKPVSHFRPAARLADIFLQIPDGDANNDSTVPLLEIILPIQSRDEARLVGVAQYILNGQRLAAEFAALDRNLFLQAAVAFLTGGLIIVAGLAWAFHRLQHSHRLLAERTAALLRANHELTLAARTSAVGAVTAHLIHELKSPLFGLQNFMTSRSAEASTEAEADWQMAVSSTRRMQTLINEVVRVLREEKGIANYEITLTELGELITAKAQSHAHSAQVQFHLTLQAEATLANREANLVLLILDLLIQNAVQATPKGKSVAATFSAAGENMRCEIADEGPGFPDELRPTLFSPCSSRKAGGNGIGLAIAKQLANHIGAELELRRSTASGCVFALTFSARLAQQNELEVRTAKA